MERAAVNAVESMTPELVGNPAGEKTPQEPQNPLSTAGGCCHSTLHTSHSTHPAQGRKHQSTPGMIYRYSTTSYHDSPPFLCSSRDSNIDIVPLIYFKFFILTVINSVRGCYKQFVLCNLNMESLKLGKTTLENYPETARF